MIPHNVKLAVTEHPKYQEEAPERFDWNLIINRREADIAAMIATDIIVRRDQWLKAGKQGNEPLIRGLQGALRLLAEKAIWKHTTVIVADSDEEPTSDHLLHGSRGDRDPVSVSAERANGVRHDRREPQVPVAGSTRARAPRGAHRPRHVGHALGA